MIAEFKGEFAFLSNHTPVKVIHLGRVFSSVEHAYLFRKLDSKEWREFCLSDVPAGKVKTMSSKMLKKHPDLLSSCWNDEFRLSLMRALCFQKYRSSPFTDLLLATGDKLLQEGNNWNDTFFGFCLKTESGLNHSGKIIMNCRSELKESLLKSEPLTTRKLSITELETNLSEKYPLAFKNTEHLLTERLLQDSTIQQVTIEANEKGVDMVGLKIEVVKSVSGD